MISFVGDEIKMHCLEENSLCNFQGSHHFSDLAKLWGEEHYFPLLSPIPLWDLAPEPLWC